jgi:hypothetical protein
MFRELNFTMDQDQEMIESTIASSHKKGSTPIPTNINQHFEKDKEETLVDGNN